MRAQFNPSRMSVIGELAVRLAEQLATHCPRCNTPGSEAREKSGKKKAWNAAGVARKQN